MTGLRLQPSPKTAAGARIHLLQGEFYVSGDPGVVLTTTLGSCVATSLHDPIARVGGMNHFLLPHGETVEGPEAVRYGAHAMELLINGLMHAGAKKHRLEAKLFGGGRLSPHLQDVGAANVAFAERFLRDEGIAYLGGSTRGFGARRIQCWPATGRVRQLAIAGSAAERLRTEQPPRPQDGGAVELFD